MRRMLLVLSASCGLAYAAGASPVLAQTYGSGYYRNDYFGSGYTGVNSYLGSVSFYDPATQGPYPYFGYGRPSYYTSYGPDYPGPANFRFSGYGGQCLGGQLPPSIMSP